MGNIIDYIEWRGDLQFDKSPLNIIDIAIFSQLVMCDFSSILMKNEKIKISKLYNKYDKYCNTGTLGLLVPNIIIKMFEKISKSDRYKNLDIFNYIKEYSEEEKKQIAALCVKIDSNTCCVVFSGTDDSIIGWIENINLVYGKSVPSQIAAKNYLDSIGKEFDKIILCGHSKGANLAMYAGYNCCKDVQDKITNIFAFDGPGFVEKFEMREEIKSKITSFVPYISVVGRLFEHKEKQLYVESKQKGLYQHDIFSWNVRRDYFVCVEKLSEYSDKINNKVNYIIDSLDNDNKTIFVNAIYSLFKGTNTKYLLDTYYKRGSLLKSYLKLDKEERKILYNIAKALMLDKYVRKTIFDSIREFNREMDSRK